MINFETPKKWGKHAKITSLFDIESVDDIEEEYMFIYSHSSEGTEPCDPTLYFTNQDGTLKGSIKPEGLPSDFAGYKSIQFHKKRFEFIINSFALSTLKDGRNTIENYSCSYSESSHSSYYNRLLKLEKVNCKKISNLPKEIGNGIVFFDERYTIS